MTIISLGHLVPATAFHEQYVQFKSVRNIIMIFFYDLFWYTGVVQLGLMAGNRYKYVDMAVNSISLCMMIISYAVIIYKVRESGRAMAKYQLTIRTRQQNALVNGVSLSCQMNECGRTSSVRPPRSQVSKKEMRLFIQFFVVSLVFLLTWTTWQWLPYMSESKWAYFVMTSLFFINNSVNPTVYIIFNTQLRRELHYLICRHHVISNAQNKRKQTLFGRGIATVNKNEADFQNNTRDDATKSLVDQAGSLSSQSHATIDEHEILYV
uniref:G_PROTEIN_RECEP_F1_2 domain-containing protein n=1 Tax=Caenorhabditis tropicalis TaxID=1561998 RepID=A0A1I7U7I2_9PELO